MFTRLTLTCLATMVPVLLASSSDAAEKKTKAKTEVSVFKLANLDADTNAADIKKLKTSIKKVKGVTKADVKKSKSEVSVRHRKEATRDAIVAAITKAGFKLADTEEQSDTEDSVETLD